VDAEALIGSLIGGALTGRRKRGRNAMRFLTGGRGSFLNASTLLTVAGVAWGLLESAQPKTTFPQPASAPPPPLPGAGAQLPPDVLRLIRLTVSAARADGTVSPAERQAILEEARQKGIDTIVEQEFERATPLDQIVAGVTDAQARADLYTLAFAIVRADEGVSGAERIYLAQLASQLGLSNEETERLEREASARIDSASTP
jgi:uncharacterized membrane protein YebE (DUF533 family)